MLLGAGANPWEKMASLYGTVLRDPSDGLFKMWYLTGPYADGMIEVRGRQALGNITLLGYATSQDRLCRWRRRGFCRRCRWRSRARRCI